jgi:hypothetical protein
MRTIIQDLLDTFAAYSESGQLGRLFLIPKIISGTICAFLVFFIIYLLAQLRTKIEKSVEIFNESIGRKKSFIALDIKKWEAIIKKIKQGDDNAWKIAIIEADKYFDDVLISTGYDGRDMGDRLKQISKAQIANIEEIWQAHKIRNFLVHEPDFEIKQEEAERVIKVYEKALKELQVL